MKKNTPKKIASKKSKLPFYVQLLTQHEMKSAAAGTTDRYCDQVGTCKYPSDSDEVILIRP